MLCAQTACSLATPTGTRADALVSVANMLSGVGTVLSTSRRSTPTKRSSPPLFALSTLAPAISAPSPAAFCVGSSPSTRILRERPSGLAALAALINAVQLAGLNTDLSCSAPAFEAVITIGEYAALPAGFGAGTPCLARRASQILESGIQTSGSIFARVGPVPAMALATSAEPTALTETDTHLPSTSLGSLANRSATFCTAGWMSGEAATESLIVSEEEQLGFFWTTT